MRGGAGQTRAGRDRPERVGAGQGRGRGTGREAGRGGERSPNNKEGKDVMSRRGLKLYLVLTSVRRGVSAG